MAVYVDDAAIPADVPNGSRVHSSQWSHLTADTQDELHEFAARLGLRRSYFQPGRPRGDGTPSPFWHYDVTAGKRVQAVRLGAVEVPWRDMPGICRARRQAQTEAPAGAPASPQPKPCDHGAEGCGEPGRPYPQGWRCDEHRPQSAYPGRRDAESLPTSTGERCPGCGTATLANGRGICQACGVAAGAPAAPQRAATYPDLSHGNPGHMCVLPGAVEREREPEAGS